jgi:hypothetical protein
MMQNYLIKKLSLNYQNIKKKKKKKKKKRERERKEYRTIGDQMYFLTVIFIGLNQSELVPRKLQSAAKWPGGCVHSSLRFREKNSTY